MNRRLLIPIVVVSFLFSCTKVERNVSNYIPGVQTISATAQPDGSVRVVGLVTKAGHTGIAYTGFCMDTLPDPDITTNQAFATTVSNDSFYCVYRSLNTLKKYYFRAWITNDENYAVGKDVSIASATYDTAQIPCHLAPSSLTFSGPFSIVDGYTNFDPITQSPDGISFMCYTNSHQVGYTFSGMPVSGAYTITAADRPSSSTLLMTFDGVRVQGSETVYVRQLTPISIELVICQVPVSISGYPFTMTTRFSVSQ